MRSCTNRAKALTPQSPSFQGSQSLRASLGALHGHLQTKKPLQATDHLTSNCLCFVQLWGSHKDLLAGGRGPQVSEPPLTQETAGTQEPCLLLWRNGNIFGKVMKKLSVFIYIKRSLMPQAVTHTWRRMSKTHVSEETDRKVRKDNPGCKQSPRIY